MAKTIRGDFATRREAELAIEHLVQEYGIDRQAVQVTPAGAENSAGEKPSGADQDRRTGDPGASPSHGRIAVSVQVEDDIVDRAEQALRQARSA